MRIAVQPCGDSDATKHYADTIEHPVSIGRILDHLPAAEQQSLLKLGLSQIPVWGVTVGKRGQNLARWKLLEPGDACLLYRNRRIFARAKIARTLRSRSLALDLWKTNRSGDTWECIYLLDDLRPIDVDVVEFNAAAGYKANNIVQGFSVLSGEKAEAVAELLEISPVDLVEAGETIGASDVVEALRRIGSNTDIPAAGKARAEASLLRRHLFGGLVRAACDICGRELPTALLVTAHIKPRASCTPEERINPRVVMRACKLGCDELYEKGFIWVDDLGVVSTSDAVKARSSDLGEALAALEGAQCGAFDKETAAFFRWHRESRPRRYR